MQSDEFTEALLAAGQLLVWTICVPYIGTFTMMPYLRQMLTLQAYIG